MLRAMNEFEAGYWVRTVEERLDRIDRHMGSIRRSLDRLTRAVIIEGENMALDLSALTAEVAAATDLDASTAVLVQRLADELDANQGDPAAVAALAQQLRDGTSQLQTAVTANTPAAPGPVEPPPVDVPPADGGVTPPPVDGGGDVPPPVEPAPA